MKKFFKEFRDFAIGGNLIDLAVGVIIGGAFNKIVTSLVNDIIMPLISILVGGMNVTDWKWVIKEAVYDAAGNVVKLTTYDVVKKFGTINNEMVDMVEFAYQY